jgi:3',5'-cyclic AMP phosphodiesterase CpdA
MANLKLSRRQFISRTAALAGSMAAGFPRIGAGASSQSNTRPLRLVFATDSHLMANNALNSGDGLIACLSAIEEITPKPDLILFGGDLTHESPQLDFPGAEQLIDRFLAIWKEHTSLPTFFTFGNHDLVGTKNSSVSRDDPRFGKGLFRARLGLERNYYAFERGGWRFVVLDDVSPEPDGSYLGEFVEEQLAFLRTALGTRPETPTLICGHIPSVSVLPDLTVSGVTKTEGTSIATPAALVTRNTADFHKVLAETKANVKLVLAGHLHHLEQIQVDGVTFFNGGAVCGNWWKGVHKGCPEGFTLFELHNDGTFSAEYRGYGWKAAG